MLISCQKEYEQVSVKYEVSNAYAATEVNYRNNRNEVIQEWIEFNSGEDIWTNTLKLERGEIVYLSAMYTDTASSVKLRIMVDGKIYKEGSSINEPDKYVTISGVVPYE
jgi:hypothetical protein